MHIDHLHELEEVVLASVQGYQFWPAYVATCLKNGCYKVSFIGVEGEAIVMPREVRHFSIENIEKLKTSHEFIKNGRLRESVSIAMKVLQERRKGNNGNADQGQMRRRSAHSRYKKKLSETERIAKKAHKAQSRHIERDIESELKESLDKLSKYSANFLNPVHPVNYTTKDAEKLMSLLSQSQKRVKQSIQKWVVQKMICALTEIHQWTIPSFEYLQCLIRSRYDNLSQFILSQPFRKFQLPAQRKANLIERVKAFKISIPPQPPSRP